MHIIRHLEDPKVKLKLATNVSNLRKEIEKLNLSQVADLRLYAKDKYEKLPTFPQKLQLLQ
ncbi:hypothetical protein ACO1CT_02020 [Bacillus velezensis]